MCCGSEEFDIEVQKLANPQQASRLCTDNVAVQEELYHLSELAIQATQKPVSPKIKRIQEESDWQYPEETLQAIVRRTFKLVETAILSIRRIEAKVETLQNTFEEILKEEREMDEEDEEAPWKSERA